ncbi:MAG: YceI family protein [Pseudonocardiaceae bacterium]
MGHDVDLRVTSLSLEVADDDAITAEFDADSLQVASKEPSSESDRRKIASNAADSLDARKFSKIKFSSTSVTRNDDSATIEGELTLHGVTNPISVQAHNDGKHWNADLTLDQTKYGIKPFSAMMGALKVKPEVKIHISVPSA